MNVRVITLNVWNTEGDPRRLDLINRELRTLAPDLLALQEVVQTAEVDSLGRLLRGLDLHATHQAELQSKPPPFADRYGGSMVATRWPHRLAEIVDQRLSDAPDMPWATLAVSVAVPGEGDMLFIGTTTAWRLGSEAARERQAVAVAELDARQRGVLPTVIAGDFNAGPQAASIRFLSGLQSLGGRSVCYHDAWTIAGEGPGHTWSVDNPNAAAGIDAIVRQAGVRNRFDDVFVGGWDAHPKAHARVMRAQLVFDEPIDGIWPSDHFGLMVDLDVGKD
jgi:endonuclease/exonuclease/phosphatase family metal-dependent hydrolase